MAHSVLAKAMKIKRFLRPLALAFLVAPGYLSAQGTPLRVGPRVGMLSPDPYLYEYFTNFAGDGPVEWTTGNLGRAVVMGLSVERDFGGGAVVVRGEMMGAFQGWTSVAHSIVKARDLFDPPYVETTWVDVPSTMTVLSLQALFPTRLVVGGVRPYVMAGLGGKYYDFGVPSSAPVENAALPDNGFTWGGDIGAGVTVPFMGLTWDLQGRDAMNRYWGKTQHDFLFTVGLLIALR
ncbi:MAG TPA: hypothetical protein VLA36_16195 [Longimicrobiales bacterium]|nr:hypothetical protein [Longimicrobiales bacterium]